MRVEYGFTFVNSTLLLFAIVAMVLFILYSARARATDLKPDDPRFFKEAHSLGQLMHASKSEPLHILFVHGMHAEGPGAARALAKAICEEVRCSLADVTPTRHFLDLDDWPKAAKLYGKPIWNDEKEWKASRPFVDRYEIRRECAPSVVLDEVNWWPLLFPIKYRALVAPESKLSGVDVAHLDLCHRNDPPYFDWLGKEGYEEAKRGPRGSSGGTLINAFLKREMINWGFSDAVMAVGPMRTYFRRAIDRAFAYAAEPVDGRAIHEQTVCVVAESLGSFVVLDAGTNPLDDSRHAKELLDRTAYLYFFANQFALLELGRISGLRDDGQRGILPPDTEKSPLDMLRDWAERGANVKGLLDNVPKARQVVAFNDPSDVLTFNVPPLHLTGETPIASVYNVSVRNAFNWFGLFTNPVKAHTGHSQNAAVLQWLLSSRSQEADRTS